MSFLQEKGCVLGGSNPRATFQALFLAVLTTDDPTLAVTLSGLAGTQRNMKLRVPQFFKLFWAAIKGWSKDDVPRLGASLAYYTLFAVGPILLIAIAIAGTVYGPDAVRGQIVGEISGLIGRQGAEAVQTILQSAHQNRTG